jgi:hypothetical protein
MNRIETRPGIAQAPAAFPVERRRFLKQCLVAPLAAVPCLGGAERTGAALATNALRPPAESVLQADVLICGGGPSGIGAALAAARSGPKVLLAERYGRLGGMAVQAMVAPLMGSVKSKWVDEILKRIGGRIVDYEFYDLKYAELLQEAGVEILLHSWAAEVVQEGRRVTGVRLFSKQGFLTVKAAVVVDATGDGDIAARAGADFEQGRPGDGLLQPMSIMYRVSGVAERAFTCGSEEQARVTRVPEGTWEEVVHRGQAAGELPATIGVIRLYPGQRPSDRVVNATQVNRVDGTKVADLTRAEFECRRQARQVVEFLKKHAPGYENAHVSAMPAIIGVRETRRVRGLQYLTREDVVAGRKWPEAVVHAASFPIDIHNPAGGGQAEGTAAAVKPYDIPYGCLVPRDVDGLLMAGRCISGSHDAHASYRVQCIAMATGIAAGAAAALAAQSGIAPRAVKVKRIQEIVFGGNPSAQASVK